MAGAGRGCTRRQLLVAGLMAPLARAEQKGAVFAPDWKRYADPTTELEVYRLTDPAFSSALPAPYNRGISRYGGGWMLFCSDRCGAPQVFSMDLGLGETRQLTDVEGLDVRSPALARDDRWFCYFAGRSLRVATISNLRDREFYRVPEGWERTPGMSLEPDGSHALFAEVRGETSRLRRAPLGRGAARTVIEAPFAISDAVADPGRRQILYRQGDEALWLVRPDGKQSRRLKTAPGSIGAAFWAPGGKAILYLSFPEDRTQLNSIREYSLEAETDKLVAKTSQFAGFAPNHGGSVFVGASRNAASPTILILLRSTRRELTLCEHKATDPSTVDPVFSPDSQRIYFQSDRDGKRAIYCMHVEKLVEKTEE